MPEPKGSASVLESGLQFIPTGNHGGNNPLALYQPRGQRISDNIPTSTEYFTLANSKVIYSSPLPSLRSSSCHGERLDISPYATPERFRFIDCASFVRSETLQIWETKELPQTRYAVISHVWKSLPPETNGKLAVRGEFLVDCEERNDGGPISVDVLRYACIASIQSGLGLLWLDRLCIVQTATPCAKQDKRWQIMHMYDVYKHCHSCFVLPAGLRRFPAKAEETEWVERAWTFQEVMIPPVVKVLYVELVGSLAEGAVHMIHIEEYFKAQMGLYGDHRDGSQERRRQFTQALDNRREFRNASAERLSREVWDYVQWRISSRPVDVVFSVMGLLGATIDPSQFKPVERLKATIAIAEALLLKDSARSTSVEIPLWMSLSDTRANDARKAGIAVKEYLRTIPTRVRVQHLDQELDDTHSMRHFASVARYSLAKGENHNEGVEDSDIGASESVNNAVIMGPRAERDIATRRFRVSRVNPALRAQRKAGRVLEDIPPEYLRKAGNTSSRDDQRLLFTTSKGIVMELCRKLTTSHSQDQEDDALGSPLPSIFAWCVESVLWIKIGKYDNSSNDGPRTDPDRYRSRPVPVITFYKFHNPCDSQK